MSRLTTWLEKWLPAAGPLESRVALYPGRFQPFGRNHFAAYNFLQEHFDDVVIITSGRAEPPRSPFDFDEKRRIVEGYGIPAEKLHRADRLLKPRHILREQGFDPRTTAAVIGIGAKDERERVHFEKHYASYESHRHDLRPASKRVYYMIMPPTDITVDGEELCGTLIRENLGKPGVPAEERRELFRRYFGWFDEEVFRRVVTRLGAEI